MFDLAPQYYRPIYDGLVAGFCLLLVIKYLNSPDCRNLLEKRSMFPALILAVALMFFIGLRPVSGRYFCDTANYALGYGTNVAKDITINVDAEKEWLWGFIQSVCETMGLTVNQWFLVIEIGYLGFAFLGLRKMLWESPWFAMLFFYSAFSAFSFGVNGLRNGLACSMIIYAIALMAVPSEAENEIIQGVKRGGNIALAAFIAFLAMGIHRSVALPILACAAAVYVVKSPRTAIYFWLASIPISYFWGDTMTNFFMDLGFDDRMTSYVVNAEKNKDFFSGGIGFRWDFLLYSSMPILLTWYATSPSTSPDNPGGTRATADEDSMHVFNVLATTYILCNSFWVMVIKASFSNRFAYLSWFLYPVVIAYAVIRLHIWDDQDRKAALILLAHVGFTMFMTYIYY